MRKKQVLTIQRAKQTLSLLLCGVAFSNGFSAFADAKSESSVLTESVNNAPLLPESSLHTGAEWEAQVAPLSEFAFSLHVVQQLKKGMSKDQVRFLLGPANLKTVRNEKMWFYIHFYQAKSGSQVRAPRGSELQRTVIIHFCDQGQLKKVSIAYFPEELSNMTEKIEKLDSAAQSEEDEKVLTKN